MTKIHQAKMKITCGIVTALFNLTNCGISVEILVLLLFSFLLFILLALQLWVASAVAGAIVLFVVLIGPVLNWPRRFPSEAYAPHHFDFNGPERWPTFPPLLNQGEVRE